MPQDDWLAVPQKLGDADGVIKTVEDAAPDVVADVDTDSEPEALDVTHRVGDKLPEAVSVALPHCDTLTERDGVAVGGELADAVCDALPQEEGDVVADVDDVVQAD